jgi:hypothetical protein
MVQIHELEEVIQGSQGVIFLKKQKRIRLYSYKHTKKNQRKTETRSILVPSAKAGNFRNKYSQSGSDQNHKIAGDVETKIVPTLGLWIRIHDFVDPDLESRSWDKKIKRKKINFSKFF